MKKMLTGPMQFTPYRPWSEERKAAARARSGPVKNWTEEDDQKILELLANGQSRKQIAVRFGVTRNAICGRVHRLQNPKTELAAPDAPHESLADLERLATELLGKPTIPTHEAEFKKWSDAECPKWPVKLMAESYIAWEAMKYRNSRSEFESFSNHYTMWLVGAYAPS